MNETKAVIIEDEYPTARLLNSMIVSLRPMWSVSILPGNVDGAIEWFDTHEQPDIIFLDIHLQNGDAFELLERARPTGLIVFTTAYDEYAMRAFSVNSIDYLLKPIARDRLAEAIAKFERLSPQQVDMQNRTVREILRVFTSASSSRTPVFRSRFLIAKGGEMHVIHVPDVAFFYTHNKTTHLVTSDNRSYVLSMRLDTLIDELNPKFFFRANRQVIVNVNAIRKIEPYFQGGVVVHTDPPPCQEKITVSKERLSAFKAWLNS